MVQPSICYCRAAGRSENLGCQYYLAGRISPCWDRVNWSAKIWGCTLGDDTPALTIIACFCSEKTSENSYSCNQIFQIKFSILIHCVKDENCSKCLHSYTCLVWLDSMHIYNAVHFMGGKKISTIYILAYKVLLKKSCGGHFLWYLGWFGTVRQLKAHFYYVLF